MIRLNHTAFSLKARAGVSQCILALSLLSSIAAAQDAAGFNRLGWHHIGWDTQDWLLALTVPILLAAILMILVMVLITVRNRYREKTVSAATSAQVFADAVDRLHLSESDVEEVRSLLTCDPAVQPQVIFQSFHLFERCVHEKISRAAAANLAPEQMQEMNAVLSTLRRKLGYHYLPTEHPLVSTRNIASGQAGAVFAASNRTPVVHHALVVRNTELLFRIQFDTEKEETVRLAPGTKVRFAFSRADDGFYGVTVPVLAFSPRGTIDLGHTLDIKRNQMRQHVRVAADVPVKFRLVKTADPQKSDVPVGDQNDARLVDISGGGLSFLFPRQLKAGDIVTTSFNFGREGFSGIPGKIVRVSVYKGKESELFKHHVQFDNIPSAKQERIVRYVFDRLRVLSTWR